MTREVEKGHEDWEALLAQLRAEDEPALHAAFKALYRSARSLGASVLENFRWLGSARERMSEDVFWSVADRIVRGDVNDAKSFFIVSLRAEAIGATTALLKGATRA